MFGLTATLNLSFRAKREIFPPPCTRNEINLNHYQFVHRDWVHQLRAPRLFVK